MSRMRGSYILLAAAVLCSNAWAGPGGLNAGNPTASANDEQSLVQLVQNGVIAAGPFWGPGWPPSWVVGPTAPPLTTYYNPAYPAPPGYRWVFPKRCYANCMIGNSASFCSANWVNFCPGS
jgi:hypothetical protein